MTPPAGDDSAVVVMTLVAEALTSISEELVTLALFSMRASVVAMRTGVAVAVTVVPINAPSAIAVTVVIDAASTVTVPAALIVASLDTALRDVVLINGAATAVCSTGLLMRVAVSKTFTSESDSARKKPVATTAELPRTLTSAATLAARVAALARGRLVTLETSADVAVSTMLL